MDLSNLTIETTEKPVTVRQRNVGPNPFDGVPAASLADGQARTFTIPNGTEKGKNGKPKDVTTALGLIRTAAYRDNVGVAIVTKENKRDKTTTVTFYGKTKTERPRKPKTDDAENAENAEQNEQPQEQNDQPQEWHDEHHNG